MIGPFAFLQTTQFVSVQPSGFVWSPFIVKMASYKIVVRTARPEQPAAKIKHSVTGHKVGFEFVNRRSIAPPKSGARLSAEYSRSLIVGEELTASVSVQSGVCTNSILS